MKNMSNKCLVCKHAIDGHPKWSDHYRSCNHSGVKGGKEGMMSLGVNASEQGIKEGYFYWPFNFDPIWLIDCKGFEEV